MKILITGGCGFLGSNLAVAALQRKDAVFIYDNLSRLSSAQNLAWLKQSGKFVFYKASVADSRRLEHVVRAIKPDVIFHLAGQVAMTTSIERPGLDFETNAVGTFTVLNAVRKYSPQTIVVYSSTNKVYGDLKRIKIKAEKLRYTLPELPNGIPETVSLEFHSPYGCSKGCADQYMLDFQRMYGIQTVVFRHSSMFGGRQFSTFDQGWISWFCQQALNVKFGKNKKPFTISGDGKQVRDVLYAEDMVDLYFSAVKNIKKTAGQAFNIGGGPENSLSLLELFAFLEEEIGVTLKYKKLEPRISDQKVFIADITKITKYTGWKPRVNKTEGIRRQLAWLGEQYAR